MRWRSKEEGIGDGPKILLLLWMRIRRIDEKREPPVAGESAAAGLGGGGAGGADGDAAGGDGPVTTALRLREARNRRRKMPSFFFPLAGGGDGGVRVRVRSRVTLSGSDPSGGGTIWDGSQTTLATGVEILHRTHLTGGNGGTLP